MNIFGLGLPELIIIFIIFLLFFGKDKLPELARSFGKSVNELKRGFNMEVDEKAGKEDKQETTDSKEKEEKDDR